MENIDDIKIRYVQNEDKSFWFTLDKHLDNCGFEKKVRDRQGYVIIQNGKPVGILRYNLFWDNTPFCTLLYVKERYRKNGLGKRLMSYWEKEMKSVGFRWLLVSTQSDENAQNFYRKIGYTDCGSLEAPGQAAEIFLSKNI